MRITVNKIYKSRDGDLVQITRELSESDIGWSLGFRFSDDKLNTYKENGSWSVGNNRTPKDLVAEV